MKSRAGLILAALFLFAGYLATGLTVIPPDEIAVVRRFGAALADPWVPGMHWGMPWGIDHLDRIKINQTRTISAGASSRSQAPLSSAPDPAVDDFLTGDLNLVTAQALVQYRVRDPALYLFRTTDIDAFLLAAAEWALSEALAERGIDELLTTGRAEVSEQLTRTIQSRVDQDGLGVSIVAVRLGRVVPPAAVSPAFADAARARSDRRQAITRAEEYRDRSRSLAQAQVREIADAAAGRFDRLVQPAQGEAARFRRVLAEASKNPEAFRRRLFLEVVGELLPRFRRTVIVAPGQDLDISLFGDEPSAPAAAGSVRAATIEGGR
jgi:modulator of FtsH protease HflK